MEKIRVGIVEDDIAIQISLMKSIDQNPSIEITFTAESMEQALGTIADIEFAGADVILLDIRLPGISGLQGIKLIKQVLPKTDIIILTSFDETDMIFDALSNGAHSYITKKTSQKVILDAIFTVHRGGSIMSPSIARKLINHLSTPPNNSLEEQLTERQMEIVICLSEGLSYKMIADKCLISIDTVRSHIKKIYNKLEIHNKVELLNMYRKMNGDSS